MYDNFLLHIIETKDKWNLSSIVTNEIKFSNEKYLMGNNRFMNRCWICLYLICLNSQEYSKNLERKRNFPKLCVQAIKGVLSSSRFLGTLTTTNSFSFTYLKKISESNIKEKIDLEYEFSEIFITFYWK